MKNDFGLSVDIVTEEAERAVDKCIDALLRGAPAVFVDELEQAIVVHRRSIAASVMDRLRRPKNAAESNLSGFLASTLLHFQDLDVATLSPRDGEFARSVVEKSVQREGLPRQLSLSAMASFLDPPDCVIVSLRDIIDSGSSLERVAAASAYTKVLGTDRQLIGAHSRYLTRHEVVESLNLSIKIGEPQALALALYGESRLGADHRRVILEYVIDRLTVCDGFENNGLIAILEALSATGCDDRRVVARVRAIVESPVTGSDLRAFAARTLGTIGCDDALLWMAKQLFEQEDWQTMRSLGRGLMAATRLTRVADYVGQMLSHENPHVRKSFATFVSADYRCARRLARVIELRAYAELDCDVLAPLADALAISRDREILLPRLTEMVRSGNVAALTAAGLALSAMEADGIMALVDSVVNHGDMYSRVALLNVSRDTGLRAEELCHIIKGHLSVAATSDAAKVVFLAVLAAQGVAARVAVKEVIDCYLSSEGDVRKQARSCIEAMGSGAVDDIKRALTAGIDDTSVFELTRLSYWLGSVNSEVEAALSQLARDDLMVWVVVGRHLDSLADGETTTFDGLLKLVADARRLGLVSKSFGKAGIGRLFRRIVAEVTKGSVIVNTKPTCLTPRGRLLLVETESFCMRMNIDIPWPLQ